MPKQMLIRDVSPSDCRDLWVWRNDPKVRVWSFHKEEIPYEEHRVWFDEQIRSENIKIYIAENREGEKLGQVRFEKREKGDIFINVNLSPSFMGKGYGAEIIREASNFFFGARPEVEKIFAEIIEGNIASCKAFEKAGYVFLNSFSKDDARVLLFCRPATQSQEPL